MAAVPKLILTADDRIDVAPSPTTDADHADPIKQRLCARLPEAVDNLRRHVNRYAQLTAPVNALRDLVSVPFAEADMLDIHLQMALLTDLREADAKLPEAERFEPECMSALNGVLRLGPPVTLGHPDVDLFEARNLAYANIRHSATEAEAERQLAQDLSQADALATERARRLAEQLATDATTGRIPAYRNGFVRNVIIHLSTVAGALEAAATGYIPGLMVGEAASFLWLHRDAIMALAPTFGETGGKWLAYILMRARQIVDDAHRDD